MRKEAESGKFGGNCIQIGKRSKNNPENSQPHASGG